MTNQLLIINNIDKIEIIDGILYTSNDNHLCLQISLNNHQDINIIKKYINNIKTILKINNFNIFGQIQQIIHSQNNVYIIVFKEGEYKYGE